MKTNPHFANLNAVRSIGEFLSPKLAAALSIGALLLGTPSAQASIAYGSINNFDTVNDTGSEAHGFEIEIDDIHSKDITYTYDYNHYGIPKITEDNSDPIHPKVFVRYAGTFANGAWSAYTAIPAGPIAPTQGHQFTNPAVNFGGEHFGVGYTAAPSAVKYNWLIDDGAHNLVHGPPVNVSTPTFTYVPPVNAQPAAVVAVVVPPPPPVPPPLQFGEASWVKEIKTKTHSAKKIALVDLVGDDEGKPQPWANGVDAADPTQIEVEVEWKLLQTDFKHAANAKGKLQGAAEQLPGGNEVITRRYEFYKYTGPKDAESGEAIADTVGPDGIHGSITVTYNDHIDPATGEWVTVTVDTSTLTIVGDFFGAQMSGFDANAKLDVIDHLQEGALNVPYVERRVVIAGNTAFNASTTGALPNGMALDPVTGILSGTPHESGLFTFEVSATDLNNVVVKKTYNLAIANGGVLPASSQIATTALPDFGGNTKGSGSYFNGTNVSLTALPNAGYAFVNWTENGVEVSNSATYDFVATGDRTLVANFTDISINYAIASSASPLAGGATAGDGSYASGANVSMTATPNAGYTFVNWTEGGAEVSTNPSYSFTAGANRTLVANFNAIPPTVPANVSPVAGATGQVPTPVLQATAFVGSAPGVTHTASEWIVRRVSDSAVVFDSGADAAHLTSIQEPTVLAYGMSYEWQVQYEDSNGVWSGYSAATSFTTQQQPVVSFSSFKGTYTGLVESDESSLAGAGSITLSAKGAVSVSFKINGETLKVKGLMNPDGTFAATILRAGFPSLNVSLVLDTMLGSDQLTGSISDGVASATVLFNRVLYSKANPVPPNTAGVYTVLLPPDAEHPEPTAPQGIGYGTLTVKTTGTVSFSGVLGDGTRVSRSTSLSKTGTVPFYTAPYIDGGAAIGWLTLRDTPNTSDLDGVLKWDKEPVANPNARTTYPAGFSLETAAVGAKYTVPAAGVRAIGLPEKAGNAILGVSSGNLVQPMPAQTITLDANNLVTVAAGSKLTVKLTPKTGRFSGKFTPPGTTKAVTFAGALFQKPDAAGYGYAAGLFTSQLQTGAVLLTPAP